jgi:hypothetical protein
LEIKDLEMIFVNILLDKYFLLYLKSNTNPFYKILITIEMKNTARSQRSFLKSYSSSLSEILHNQSLT